MIDRRTFTALLAGTIAAPRTAWSQTMPHKAVFYASVGPALTLYHLDVDKAALSRQSTVQLPANVQYAWPHMSAHFLYVASSTGGPGIAISTIATSSCPGGPTVSQRKSPISASVSFLKIASGSSVSSLRR